MPALVPDFSIPPFMITGSYMLRNNVAQGRQEYSADGGVTWNPSAFGTPIMPLYYHSSANIDGQNNATLTDGAGVGIWRNLGTKGAEGDLVQGTTGIRPIYRLVGQAGKIYGRPAVEGTGTQWMSSVALAVAQVQPIMVATVFQMTDLLGNPYVISSGNVAGAEVEMSVDVTTGLIKVSANAGFTSTGQNAVAGKWHTSILYLGGAAGAGGYHILDGTQTAPINFGTRGFAGITLFAESAGAFISKMKYAERAVWVGGGTNDIPDPTDVKRWLGTIIGSTPQ